jgi:outer membrane lipoprotein-sorting protein
VKQWDDNMWLESASYSAEMIIHTKDRVDRKEMIIYSKGKEKTFSEFHAPAKDKGTKFLRIDKTMWMYLPAAEKVIQISGHMLRQSMMGSDFSYEDALERSKRLIDYYQCELLGTENLKDSTCYLIELLPKLKEVTYYRRKVWLDQQTYLPLREELYAKSGKLLKVMEVIKVEKIGKRYYPTHIVMEDKLKKGSKTEFVISNLRLDTQLPDDMFSLQKLEK